MSGCAEKGLGMPVPGVTMRVAARRRIRGWGVGVIAALCASVSAEPTTVYPLAARTEPRRHRVTFNLSITGGKEETRELAWAVPVLSEWPTQTDVTFVSVKAPREAQVTLSADRGTLRYAMVRASPVRRGEKITAQIVFDTTLWKLLPDLASCPARVGEHPSAEIRRYLARSRGIESGHQEIIAKAREILSNAPKDPIEQAALLRAWVRNNVTQADVAYPGALAVLRKRKGSCQEKTGLFVALSRAAGIPARCVTTIGHAYAEFHVEPWGWLPTETTKLSGFGCRKQHKIILTKGEDNLVGEMGGARSTFFFGYHRYSGGEPKLEQHITVSPLEDGAAARAASANEFVNSIADTGHHVQVWEVTVPVEAGRKYSLAAQHGAAGARGAFHLVVWTDTDGDGKPDEEVGRSKLLRGRRPGRWSDWTFTAPETPIFAGTAWPQEDELVFYQKGGDRPKAHADFGDTVFYSRTFEGAPNQQAKPRYTNLRIAPTAQE